MKSIAHMSQAELAAYIQSAMRNEGIDLVLTGGAVVSIYSKGKYTSMDLDLVDLGFTSYQKLKTGMQKLGFKKETRHFTHPQTKYLVELVASPLSVGNEPVSEIVELKYPTGSLKVISATDCVKDRLAAYYYWNDKQALAQAVLVAGSAKINLKEIERWSAAEKMREKFAEFLAARK